MATTNAIRPVASTSANIIIMRPNHLSAAAGLRSHYDRSTPQTTAVSRILVSRLGLASSST